jgi:membrane fusion protein (multidrug efflux system)
MQTKKTILCGLTMIALSVSLALSGCGRSAEAGPHAAGPAVVGVSTVAAQSVALDSELSGRTSPFAVADIRPQVSGIVMKRLFTEGGEVKAGQSLYQIDPATYRASLDSAQASLAQAEANLVSARLKADRYKQLIAINAVGQQDYDDAVATAKADQALVASGKAAVDTARINLTYSKVLSPISGRIGKSSVTEGALVSASQTTALATVQQLDPIYVDVTRSNSELMQLKRDLASGAIKSAGANQARVKLVLEDGTVYPLEGKLQFSDITVSETTGSVTLRALFPNPKHDLLPGMYVRARLVEGVNDKAILVPQDAVSHDTKGNAVAMVVGPDGKVQPRILQISRNVGNKWLVNSGLNAGDQLIVDGLQNIRPGMPVKAVPVANKAAGAGE